MQPEDPIVGAVDRLSARLAGQTEAIDDLHVSIQAEADARDRKVKVLQRVLVVVLTALVLLVAAVGTNLYTLQVQNDAAKDRAAAATAQRNQQQVDTEKLLSAIKGCTEPGGACFRANREDTASALQMLQRFEYVVGYCSASFPNSPTEYKSCVLSFKVPGAPTDLPTQSK